VSKPWIRLYTNVPDNAKVQRLPPALFKFWINCLCLYGDKGYFPTIDTISWKMKISEKVALKNIRDLIDAHLFDEEPGDKGFEDILFDALTPHDWDELQFESDSSTERVKKHRDRFRKQKRNVSVTPPEAETEQIQSRAEAERPAGPSPDLYASEFTAEICRLGFRNPDSDPVTAYNTALIAEACEQAGATPKLGAWVAADLMKAQRFKDKPLEYLLGALRSQLAQKGPNRKALARVGSA